MVAIDVEIKSPNPRPAPESLLNSLKSPVVRLSADELASKHESAMSRAQENLENRAHIGNTDSRVAKALEKKSQLEASSSARKQSLAEREENAKAMKEKALEATVEKARKSRGSASKTAVVDKNGATLSDITSKLDEAEKRREEHLQRIVGQPKIHKTPASPPRTKQIDAAKIEEKLDDAAARREVLLLQRAEQAAFKKQISPPAAPSVTSSDISAKLDGASSRREEMLKAKSEACKTHHEKVDSVKKTVKSSPENRMATPPKKLHHDSEPLPSAVGDGEKLAADIEAEAGDKKGCEIG
jgi:hypothetical protein